MDLSFSLKPTGRRLRGALSFADIRVAADQWRSDYASEKAAAALPGEDGWPGKARWTHILACRVAREFSDPADMAILGGSFNPLVARQLMVGEG